MTLSKPSRPLRLGVLFLILLAIIAACSRPADNDPGTPTPLPIVTGTAQETIIPTITPTREPTQTLVPPTEPPPTNTPTPSPTPTPAPISVGQGDTLDLVLLADAASRQALCNDGSPAGFYLRRAADQTDTRWLIHLEGEGMCTDEASCEARSADFPDAFSSQGLSRSREEKGILSTDPLVNAEFYNINHVSIPYCSSDLWTGQGDASAETSGIYFQGATILAAVLEELRDPVRMGSQNLAQASEILLTGSNAGGVGVLQHLDWLGEQYPSALVSGINDGGWLISAEPRRATNESIQAQIQRGMAYWSGRVDQTCAAAHPEQPSDCYFGAVAAPEVSQPLFVQSSLQDVEWLALSGAVPPYNTNPTANYVVEYASRAYEELQTLPAVFAPSNVNSTLLLTNRFNRVNIDNTTLQDAIRQWYSAESAVTRYLRPVPTAQAVKESSGEAGDMLFTAVANAESRQAVCNDGSPSGYYTRRSSDPTSTQWLVFFEGGGACYDAASCRSRNLGSRLTSSNQWLPSRTGTGIQSASAGQNPAFADFNHVYIPYCSSDLWTGNRGASSATNNWHFRGAAILNAVFADLSDPAITPLSTLADATDILIVGGSAGGMGVMSQLDRAAALFPDANVMGVNDGGYFIDFEPYNPRRLPPKTQFQRGYSYTGALLDETCVTAHPGQEWQCYVGPMLYPYVETPLFVQIDQYDSAQLRNLGLNNPAQPEQIAYAQRFRAALLDAVRTVQPLFSPSAAVHVMTKTNLLTSIVIDGVTLQDAIANWFSGAAPDSRYIDTTAGASLIDPPPDVPPADATMQLKFVEDATRRSAVCNDGSAAGYYIQRSPDPDVTQWVVMLGGGGACYDVASCGQRTLFSNLTSSNRWPQTTERGSLLAVDPAENPDFYFYNHVFVPYCSSDFWSGRNSQTIGGREWQFQGRAILLGVFSDLSDRAITGENNLARASEVLIVGNSAGGVGVMAQLDRIADGLPWAEVKGINGSGWVVDVPVFDASLPPLAEQLQKLASFTGTKADDSCESLLGSANSWRCLWGQVAYPYIETPLFVYMNQLDSAHLNYTGVTEPFDSAESRYLDATLRPAIVSSLSETTAVFSANSTVHGDLSLDFELDGVTLGQAVAEWYFRRTPQQIYIEE